MIAVSLRGKGCHGYKLRSDEKARLTELGAQYFI